MRHRSLGEGKHLSHSPETCLERLSHLPTVGTRRHAGLMSSVVSALPWEGLLRMGFPGPLKPPWPGKNFLPPPSPAASISCPSQCPRAWHSLGVVKAGPGNLGSLACPQPKFTRSQNHNVLAGTRAQIRGCRGMSGRPTGRPQPTSGSWEAFV